MSLTIEDLSTILSELNGVVSSWSQIGLQLGLTQDEIDALPDTTDKSKALRQVVTKVLHRKKLTWEEIAIALESKLVDRGTTADNIREKYPKSSKP